MFLLKRSFSMLASFSFFFCAPGRLFKLLCRIFASPITLSSSLRVEVYGSASASDSRFVTSFLEGRRRFLIVALNFSMRERRTECLMVRLSFFDVTPRRPRSLPLFLLLVRLEEAVLGLGRRARGTDLFLTVGMVGACALSDNGLVTAYTNLPLPEYNQVSLTT